MVRITLDIFSGRPNPSWVLDEAEAREVVRAIAADRDAVVDATNGGSGRLGYRGMIVQADDERLRGDLPAAFRIGAPRKTGRGQEIVERLLERVGRPEASPSATGRARGVPFDLAELEEIDFRRLVRDELDRAAAEPEAGEGSLLLSTLTETAAEGEASLAAGATVLGSDASSFSTVSVGSCQVEVAAFNPTFWNAAGVQPYNNCYNYATNRRTDTFAQPGRATGAQARRMRCDAVSPAAVSDGALVAPNCAPAGQEPRWYMALVVWPGTDYHWYRLQQEGFWGHKPGQTAARNTDNSGVVISSPETANRGGYRDFCGYLFAQASQVIQ